MQEIRNHLRRKLQAEVKNGDEFDEFKVVAFCQHVNAVWGEKNNGGRVEPVFTDAEKFVKDILRCGDAAGGSRSVGELASAAGGAGVSCGGGGGSRPGSDTRGEGGSHGRDGGGGKAASASQMQQPPPPRAAADGAEGDSRSGGEGHVDADARKADLPAREGQRERARARAKGTDVCVRESVGVCMCVRVCVCVCVCMYLILF
jgi:hypothetical protein